MASAGLTGPGVALAGYIASGGSLPVANRSLIGVRLGSSVSMPLAYWASKMSPVAL